MSPNRSEALQAARSMLGLSLQQLWLDYIRLGGSLPPADLNAFLDGGPDPGDHDHDIIVQALNEHFIDNHDDHPLSYADELAPPPKHTAGPRKPGHHRPVPPALKLLVVGGLRHRREPVSVAAGRISSDLRGGQQVEPERLRRALISHLLARRSQRCAGGSVVDEPGL